MSAQDARGPRHSYARNAPATYSDDIDATIRALYIEGVTYAAMVYEIIKRHGRQYNYRQLGDRARLIGCAPSLRAKMPKPTRTEIAWSADALGQIRALWDAGKTAADVAAALSGQMDDGRPLTREAVCSLVSRHGWKRARPSGPRGPYVQKPKYDPWVGELIRERYIEGTPWEALREELASRGVHMTIATLKTRANSIGLRETDRKVKLKPKPRVDYVKSIGQANTLSYGWTPDMDAALREYAAVKCTIVVTAKLLAAEFDLPVEQAHISDRVKALGLRLRDAEGSGIVDRENKGYAIGGRRFWSRDDITRKQALRQLEVNGFYYRVHPGDRNTNPAWGFLIDGRASLERTIMEARAHFGVTEALIQRVAA